MTPNLPASTPAITSAQPPELPSESLFKGHKELHIRHAGEQYRLRITRSGKLILTK
ncbi:MAG: hemin uptake protein HemP [Chromatiales bacterium]|nr:hemin uptake protein HemP [Gammaproteobacteria bacterium]MCP5352367.1 hemin uptake protein HemP [Chromatiales bacterium]